MILMQSNRRLIRQFLIDRVVQQGRQQVSELEQTGDARIDVFLMLLRYVVDVDFRLSHRYRAVKIVGEAEFCLRDHILLALSC